MPDFFTEYFVDPIVYGTGYNIYNTILYAALLIVAVFVLIRILRKLDIKMDARLWYSLLPFVLLGGVVRALQDQAFFTFLGDWQFLFVTPLIYILLFVIAFACILLSKRTDLNITFWTGSCLLAIFAVSTLLLGRNWLALLEIFALTVFVFAVVYFAIKWLRLKTLDGYNWMPLFGHTLDACASTVAITVVGGYAEQHVLPSFLFSFLPFWFFIPIKVLIILGAIHIISKEARGNWRWMLLFTVFVLGMGPGLRNTLTVFMGS